MRENADREGHFGPRRVRDRTVALINAAGRPTSDPPSAAVVAAILREHGELDPEVQAAEIPELVVVATQLYRVCSASTDGDVAAALNRLFADYATAPRLTDHDGTPWHLHLDSADDAPLHEWIATSGALALAALFAEHGRGGWGVCRAEGCGRVFLTTGAMRRRTACSQRCATRERVRAHRCRQLR